MRLKFFVTQDVISNDLDDSNLFCFLLAIESGVFRSILDVEQASNAEENNTTKIIFFIFNEVSLYLRTL